MTNINDTKIKVKEIRGEHVEIAKFIRSLQFSEPETFFSQESTNYFNVIYQKIERNLKILDEINTVLNMKKVVKTDLHPIFKSIFEGFYDSKNRSKKNATI